MSEPGPSRRAFLSKFLRPLKSAAEVPEKETAEAAAQRKAMSGDLVAIVQGRHCLATVGVCRICVDQCPVEGALVLNQDVPMVVADLCTGCRVCEQVCPAPTNAILMIPKRRQG